jgi:hypothetical protein
VTDNRADSPETRLSDPASVDPASRPAAAGGPLPVQAQPPGWAQSAWGPGRQNPAWGPQQPYWPRQVDPATAARDALNKRLETVSWGLFIIMIGGFALVPADRLPQGSWLIGIGIILLGLNAVRLAIGIRISVVTSILGLLALVGGTGDMLGVDVPTGGLLLVLVGAAIIVRALDPRRT